ncbi:hypothetical protein BHE74_00037445 [Ensete ventricosum]|nr:hypothetical protein GW17_00058240 [Ensete ventricosum]RWW55880.1 hypothetical protein BHE74_00037445 [Ensete ventricosum]RZS08047.1 hypothetical protein BHM03_00038978 [Ensete ventricosum]
MTMNLKKGADDSARAKFDNPIRSDYHAPKSSSAADGVRKVSLLIEANAIMMVHEEDDFVQKNASAEK